MAQALSVHRARANEPRKGAVSSAPPQRLVRVFDQPILAWQRLETEPLDAAYYVLLATGDELVLWINQRAQQKPKIARYVAAMRLLPELTAPLVRADTTLTRLECPYLITRYSPVPTLTNVWPHLAPRDRVRAANAWGRALRLVHRIRFDLAGDLAYPEADGKRLDEFLEMQWRVPLTRAIKDHMVDTPKLIGALQRGRSVTQDAPITLCHGLPKADAFLFDQKRSEVVSILDFGDASRTDPMSDLAAIYFTDLAVREAQTSGCQTAFIQGYGALSVWEKERLSFYRLHHTLLRYARALEHFPNQIASYRLQLMDLLNDPPPL